ncbi:M61 family metallopeptidase [Shewanella sp. 4t3-1-2LB]|uniref:M61 family metallopeptidase n=1 Tax=Shewanella sp. 4t3-1-2LB TaxID=2817682 RepID=UPI001A99C0C0|nr:M61 family metallopeptidase [Shewanella sp. 4t3-1-2LB]
MKISSLSMLSLTSLLALGNVSQAAAEVQYQIDISSPEHHMTNVRALFPATEGNVLRLNLPIWRTGRYQVLPLADGVRHFEARDAAGKALSWQRTDVGEWQINLEQPTAVTISYQLYANELGQRVRHIDATHAFLDASGTLMYSPNLRQESVQVALTVPAGWQSFSGMTRLGPQQFSAANYDVLVDSPIETGISQQRSFDADGKRYQLVVWGAGNYNLEQIVGDLKKVTAASQAIWDGYPFDNYVFMVHATNGARGATEHINSTVIQLPRFNFRERNDYLRFISTAAHEFIHTWNVKAYRPDAMVPYRYQQENMTPLLWIAEGSTSYFQNQLLLRAGVMTPKEFLDDLAKRIDANQHTPGREVQSVAAASLNQWTSRGGDYAVNNSVNIYSEGYMASLALDFSLLHDTELKASYRDVHRRLYRDYRVPKGYDVADVQQILQQLTGRDYHDWWQQHIDAPLSLDFAALLAQAGLQLSYGTDSKMQPYIGVTLGDGLTLSRVARNSPAWQAGLDAGDELLALNGIKLTAEGFSKRLNDFQAGETIALTLFSNDTLVTRQVVLGQQASGKLQLQPVKGASGRQKAFFKAWLGIDWPFDNKGNFKN